MRRHIWRRLFRREASPLGRHLPLADFSIYLQIEIFAGSKRLKFTR